MERKVYRTMQGREVDLDALRLVNEHVPAVGNAKLNARGDQLGPDGRIIKTREQLAAENVEQIQNPVMSSNTPRKQPEAPVAPAPVQQVEKDLVDDFEEELTAEQAQAILAKGRKK